MPYELIITEKPKAAQKIAEALADGKPIKNSRNKIPYYELKHKNNNIIVACAVGHLYQVAEKEPGKFSYPVFDIDWQPAHSVSKSAKFSKKYLDTIKSLSKDATSFTVATDYDIEGEVIGYTVIRLACKQKDAQRMKFSTLTTPDLVSSYAAKMKTIDWGQANAGITRHFLDWIYGINLSRALTTSVRKMGLYKVLSAGRVQGPALKILVDREKEIAAFKPEDYWQIQLIGDARKKQIEAWHEKDKLWEEKEADSIIEKTRGKPALVEQVDKKQFMQAPPPPFDLTTLQTEVFRCFRINPKEALEHAQNLYISGFISYPRTSSQILPTTIGYKKIFDQLSKQSAYNTLCNELMTAPLNPNNGKKTDPAHPAIYPTGIPPKALTPEEQKVYDLIVKRFLSVFAEPAARQTMKVDINVNQEIFVAKGTTTLKPGWHRYYAPYLNLKEVELPSLEKGESIAVREITKLAKQTQPSKRYTQASLIKELEKRNLGTKATRANIIDTLFQRGYISGRPIEASKLGIIIVDTLQKYAPSILDEELTRNFEEEMEKVREGQKTKDEVFNEAKKVLTKTLEEIKGKEKLIGKELAFAKIETDKKENTLGACPACGNSLVIRRGKYGQFIACSNYPECKVTFNLPNSVLAKPTENKCEKCGYPIIKLIRRGKKPQETCINSNCSSKENGLESGDKKCPKCGAPLVVRKSIYGQFLGCSKYPTCKYTEKVSNGA
ncbi:MAG: DNA topoisomerase I [Candidatus Woesearchaeota archaeon]